jgi:predicted dinucleotide-binding enzyme
MKLSLAASPRRRLLIAAALAAGAAAALPESARAQASPLRIGVIGAGRIGGALAEHWAKAGHQLLISSRHPDELKALAGQLGGNVRVGTPAEAAAFGEVVLISVPYAALPEIARDVGASLRGKVILDTCNPVARRDGAMAEAALAKGSGIASAELFPGAHLVRAFNSIPAAAVKSEANRSGERIGVPLAGDDAKSLHVAERLVRDAGFEPVIVGGLRRAREFDYGTPVFGKALAASELRAALAVKSGG